MLREHHPGMDLAIECQQCPEETRKMWGCPGHYVFFPEDCPASDKYVVPRIE
jgi:hypothetical protein